MRADIALGKNFRIKERHNFQYRLEIFNLGSLWRSNINGGPNGGGGIRGNMQAHNFGSLVPIDMDANGKPLPENLQSGVRRLWNPRVIQMALKYTF
jgi:hypothetical protein